MIARGPAERFSDRSTCAWVERFGDTRAAESLSQEDSTLLRRRPATVVFHQGNGKQKRNL